MTFLFAFELTMRCQIFCKLVEEALRDLDILLVPITKEFQFGEKPDLLEHNDTMKSFLECFYDEGKRKAWTAETKRNWQETYDSIGKAFAAKNLKGSRERRHLLRDHGLLDSFSSAYKICFGTNSFDCYDLRHAGSETWAKSMRAYTTKIVDLVTASLEIDGTTIPPQTWQSQILSKIRYLTSGGRFGLAAKPFLCLLYLEHVLAQLGVTPKAWMEVRTFHLQSKARYMRFDIVLIDALISFSIVVEVDGTVH